MQEFGKFIDAGPRLLDLNGLLEHAEIVDRATAASMKAASSELKQTSVVDAVTASQNDDVANGIAPAGPAAVGVRSPEQPAISLHQIAPVTLINALCDISVGSEDAAVVDNPRSLEQGWPGALDYHLRLLREVRRQLAPVRSAWEIEIDVGIGQAGNVAAIPPTTSAP